MSMFPSDYDDYERKVATTSWALRERMLQNRYLACTTPKQLAAAIVREIQKQYCAGVRKIVMPVMLDEKIPHSDWLNQLPADSYPSATGQLDRFRSALTDEIKQLIDPERIKFFVNEDSEVHHPPLLVVTVVPRAYPS